MFMTKSTFKESKGYEQSLLTNKKIRQMNTIKILSLFIFTLIIGSCSSTKKVSADDLFNTTWELEYLSGPRIAFDGLYPDTRPKSTINKTTPKVDGNNSCNGSSADYTFSGDGSCFGEAGPTTMM